MERKLATVDRIVNLERIDNADNLLRATVRGWTCVVRKDEFNVGDKVIFVEPDSVLPPKPDFQFLAKNNYRVKTIKLRGQVSQGLCLPLSLLPVGNLKEGDDVTKLLGIEKYNPPMPISLDGEVLGPFPGAIPKTDQERIQNYPQLLQRYEAKNFYITEKIDGTSMTIFYSRMDRTVHVCSRNLDLKDNPNNLYWRIARKYDLINKLNWYRRGWALQGEVYGEGIQGNPLGIQGQRFALFDVYQYYKGKFKNCAILKKMAINFGLDMVPLLGMGKKIPLTIDEVVSVATRKSMINPDKWAEGIVVRPMMEWKDIELGRLTWKCINPEYLVKNDG